MKNHWSTRVGAAVAAGAVIAVSFAGSASAKKPAEQACLGEFFSGAAQALGSGFGQQVALFAGPESPLLFNYGQAVQNLQAGTAPRFPFVCVPPE